MNKIDQVVNDFGMTVKALRIAKGISQEAFAQQAGLDRSYYGRIERSAANPTLRNIAAIANALEISINDLFVETAKQASRKRPK
ncbi:MAG: helix-turn-helix domain-containing protein [Cyanobacteria bacterium REEB67]|nr:helix-turn-helix domain-containing protein [Cyanobacteria bacterium REEB67]